MNFVGGFAAWFLQMDCSRNSRNGIDAREGELGTRDDGNGLKGVRGKVVIVKKRPKSWGRWVNLAKKSPCLQTFKNFRFFFAKNFKLFFKMQIR